MLGIRRTTVQSWPETLRRLGRPVAAAAVAGYKGIGILLSAPDKMNLAKSLAAAGADHIVDSFEELRKIIS